MQRTSFFLLMAVLLVVALCGATAFADPVNVGDTIRFINRNGSPGGEFGIALSADPTNTLFVSFCLEENEYLNFQDVYTIEGITNAAMAGGLGGAVGGSDPISDQTAWLYWAFRTGLLESVYMYNGGATSANALQKAIWAYENEETPPTSGYALTLYDAAQDAIDNGWTNSGRVGVLNLVTSTGTRAQDQLVLVPEPATLLLLGTGLVLMSLLWRRRALSKLPSRN